MTGKQQLVGWLGLGLVIANLLDGALHGSLHLITGDGTHDHSSSGGGLFGIPGLPGGGGGGGGLIPNIPLVPQGPLTGIPFSPISNPAGQPANEPHQAATTVNA